MARVNTYGARRFGSKLTRQEEEIIDVSFESFRDLDDLEVQKNPALKGDKRAGAIHKEKLTEAFASIHAAGDLHDIQMLIDDLDESGSGKIDYQSWRAMMSRKFLGEEDDASIGHVFAMLDSDKDGYVTLVELRRMLMQEGQAPLSEQEVDELLLFADPNSDGLINYRDFLQWLANPEAYARHHQPLEEISPTMTEPIASSKAAPGAGTAPPTTSSPGAAGATTGATGATAPAKAAGTTGTTAPSQTVDPKAAGAMGTGTATVPPTGSATAPKAVPGAGTGTVPPTGSSATTSQAAPGTATTGAAQAPPATSKASPAGTPGKASAPKAAAPGGKASQPKATAPGAKASAPKATAPAAKAAGHA